MDRTQYRGFVYGVTAFVLWGVFPVYFRALHDVPAAQIVAHRILWCLLCVTIVILAQGRGRDVVRSLGPGRLRWLLLAASLLIGATWFVYVYSIAEKDVVQISLGYFITPLFNVVLALVVFREQLRPAVWVGLGIAAVGLMVSIREIGQVPWIAFGLVFSFGLYGLVRKLVVVNSMVGLVIETLLLAPLAAAYLGYCWYNKTLVYGTDAWRDILVSLAGVVTAIPLLCFARAARLLPMATLGLLQYLSPTGQLLIALLVFHEPFPAAIQVGFYCTWVGLALITIDGLYAARGRVVAARRLALELEAQGAGADR